jgi:hypothetical protein
MKEVVSWMNDQGFSDLAKTIIYTAIESRIKSEEHNATKCIICNKYTTTYCAYCFFFIAIRVLRELNFDEKSLTNFLESFNYSLGHSEY